VKVSEALPQQPCDKPPYVRPGLGEVVSSATDHPFTTFVNSFPGFQLGLRQVRRQVRGRFWLNVRGLVRGLVENVIENLILSRF